MSDQKTGKPQAVIPNQRSFKGKDGTQFYVHGVLMEGSSTIYEYLSSKPTCEDFKVNEEVTYTVTTSEYNGNTSYKIKPVKGASSSGGWKGGGGKSSFVKSPETETMITLQSIFSSLCTLKAGSTTKVDDIWKGTVAIHTKMLAHAKSVVAAAEPAPATPVSTPAPVQQVAAPPVNHVPDADESLDLPF